MTYDNAIYLLLLCKPYANVFFFNEQKGKKTLTKCFKIFFIPLLRSIRLRCHIVSMIGEYLVSMWLIESHAKWLDCPLWRGKRSLPRLYIKYKKKSSF